MCPHDREHDPKHSPRWVSKHHGPGVVLRLSSAKNRRQRLLPAEAGCRTVDGPKAITHKVIAILLFVQSCSQPTFNFVHNILAITEDVDF